MESNFWILLKSSAVQGQITNSIEKSLIPHHLWMKMDREHHNKKKNEIPGLFQWCISYKKKNLLAAKLERETT